MRVDKERLSQPYLLTITEDDLKYIKAEKEKCWQSFKSEKTKLVEKNIPGFRVENAPRSLGEKKFELGQIYKELLNKILSQGLIESKLTIIAINSNRVTVGVNDGPIVVIAEVEIVPTVGLGQYKGLEIKYDSVEVTDPEVEASLQRLREGHGTKRKITDRAVQDKDTVSLEFVGKIDGHEFDGGSTKKADGKHNPWSLKIGSGQFIKGFEEQLMGMKIDEPRTIKITFPENYHKQEFRSKEATFEVTVKSITVEDLPLLNDEFAKKIGYQNLVEARGKLKEDLASNKRYQNEAIIENRIFSRLDEVCEVSAIPKKVLNEHLDVEFQRVLKQVNLDEKGYFERTRSTRDDFDHQYRPIVEKDFRIRYIMEAIGAKEKITMSDEEMTVLLDKEASRKQVSVKQLDHELIRKNGIIQKTLEFIKKEAKIRPSEPAVKPKVTELTLKEK